MTPLGAFKQEEIRGKRRNEKCEEGRNGREENRA